MKKNAARILAMVLCLCMVLSACSKTGGKESQQPSNNPGTVSQAPDESKQPTEKAHPVLRLPALGDATQLDPHVSNGAEYNLLGSLYDGLVRFDGSNQMAVVPDLAESWDISDDQLTYTFHIRENAKFSDGTPFTAEDAAFSVKRMQTLPATSSKVLMIKDAEAIDEHTLNIYCNWAYPNLILQMASWPWRMVSKAAVEKYGDGTPEMVLGTGPYKLESWVTGVGVTLVRNEYYWGKTPYFDKIETKVIPDMSTQLVALENGEVDAVQIVNGLDLDYYSKLDGYRVEQIHRPGAYSVMFNVGGSESLSKLEVRQAFNYAINREELCALVYDNMADPNTYSVIREGDTGFTNDLPHYDYNVETAKQLLADAGYAKGVTIGFTYPTTTVGERLAAALKDMLAPVGINLDLVPMEASAYQAAVFMGNYETCYVEFQSVPYNPPLVYNLYFITGGSLAYCHTTDEYIDTKAAEAARTLDDDARNAMYLDLNTHIREQAYYAVIGGMETYMVYPSGIHGEEYEPNTMLTKYMDWYWEE